jgi:hypothetical protein
MRCRNGPPHMQLCDLVGLGMRVSGVWHATLTHLGVVDVDAHNVLGNL